MTDHHHHDQVQVPKGILIAAGLLISITMVAVAAFRISGAEPVAQVPTVDATHKALDLSFKDGAEGTVKVIQLIDGQPDHLLHVVQPGEGGFIRGILRSLARSRRASGISREHPFRLIMQSDGVLLLQDPQTGQRIYLPAFGPSNVESFQTIMANGYHQR